MWAQMEKQGHRFYNNGLPQLCTTCQIPMGYTEPGDPTTIAFRSSMHRNERYHFCSDGCKDIFDFEPEKYAQSWLPVHQIFQGNCGGATMPDVLNYYKLNNGEDNLDFGDSPDRRMWDEWQASKSRLAG